MQKKILADGRWQGSHGIGRFSHEVLLRLQQTDILTHGPKPLSLKNLAWLPYQLYKNFRHVKVYFNPGFNPIFSSPIPFVFTLHDLTHLYLPGNHAFAKKIYYETLIKHSIKKASAIFTVSHYSKKNIIDWSGISEDKVIVVSSGIDSCFAAVGEHHQPGYPYVLHTGNTKAHKNIARLIEAFAIAKIDSAFHLILTGDKTLEIQKIINKYRLENRIIFSGLLSDKKLVEYYRGATAFLFPSLHEGFGLPVLEAMSCGIPTLTSHTTSLPEVAGDAAMLIDPYHIDSIVQGIERIIHDTLLRNDLIQKGFARTKLFSWDKTARKIQDGLDDISCSYASP